MTTSPQETQYAPGSLANGHVLGHDGTWYPVVPTEKKGMGSGALAVVWTIGILATTFLAMFTVTIVATEMFGV